MTATTYRIKYLEEQTIKLIIAGFTRILKGWYLSHEKKIYIDTCVKREDNQQIL